MKKRTFLKRILAVTAALAALGTVVVLAKNDSSAPNRINIYSQNFTPINVNVVSETGQLVFSDSPEYVEKSGTLSAGTVQGDSRVYFYHVNEMKNDQKIAIIFENKNNQENQITITRKLLTKPSDQYFEVGRELSRKDLETNAMTLEQFVMTPGTRQQVFKELERVNVKRDQLFSGILDFTATRPVFVRVMMLDRKTPAVGASYTSEALPMDEVKLRGTYTGSHRVLTTSAVFNPKNGAASIELVNDREDPYLHGIDELTNDSSVRNRGNYGVDYTLTIPTEGTKQYDVYFNPIGGDYAGSVKLTNNGKSKFIDVPSRYIESIGHGTVMDTQLLGTYSAGTPLEVKFMPAGASNLPVRLLLTPHVDMKDLRDKQRQEEVLHPSNYPSVSDGNDSGYIPESQIFTVVKEGETSTSIGQPIASTPKKTVKKQQKIETTQTVQSQSGQGYQSSIDDQSIPWSQAPKDTGVSYPTPDNSVPISNNPYLGNSSTASSDTSEDTSNQISSTSIGNPLK